MKTWIRIAAHTCAAVVLSAPHAVAEWPLWRGPHQTGAADDTALVTRWSPEGENLAWKVPFIGRSTPVVLHGRACVIGRVGDGIDKQEVVACYDAGTGEKIWERRHNVYHTTVAFNRLGWASMAGDVETGNVYAHGAAGQLIAYDPKGEVLWQHFTPELFGRASGYGGRTQTPIVWGDQLLITFVSIGWGDQAVPRHRYYSFDKRTGALLWVSTPGGRVFDMNTQSGPVVAEIDGRSLLIAGNADGHVYAVDVGTGKKVWDFALSRRGLNSTVLVAGDTVFISHSEENLDGPTQGRLVAFRGTGTGEITGQELWRHSELKAGFPSPAYSDGKLYTVDNSANMYRIDAETGEIEWEYGLGTVGKASPVLADGKIYVPELNGRFHILADGDEGPTELDLDELLSEGDRYAEIYGSAAVAYGRIYLSTEGWLYCIGDKKKKFKAADTVPVAALPEGSGKPAWVQVIPAEVVIAPGESIVLTARTFDAKGHPLGTAKAKWSTEGIDGKVSGKGKLGAAKGGPAQAGAVVATVGEISGRARVRVIPPLPWSDDFESRDVGSVPATWIGARGKFKVVDKDGGKVLAQPVRERGLQRSFTYLGGDFSNYTIEADAIGQRVKRRVTDVGVINAGYTMDLMGYHQRIEIRSWAAEKRMSKTVDFEWDMDVWYRLKLSVQLEGDVAKVRGKVWKRDDAEPADWTIEVEDPLPIGGGSPGLIGYAPAEIFYDNLDVYPNP